MSRTDGWRRARAGTVSVAVISLAALAIAPAYAGPVNKYKVTRIVTDATGAPHVDKSLVNPWGMAQGPSTPVWVSDNGTDVSTLYQVGAHPKVPLTVQIPGGAPTGQVYNGGPGFVVKSTAGSGAATFIFDSEAGVLSGWNQMDGTHAIKSRAIKNAVFKGLTIATVAKHRRLYATDFHNGRVVMFNPQWKTISAPSAFKDSKLPAGYAPFGIATLNQHIYVSYAKQDAARHDDVRGPGHGFIDVYSRTGSLLKRLVSGGALNSPWGMVIAPKGFGPFSGRLIVGNFGNGRINAYNFTTGARVGTLKNTVGKAIVLPGLWGLLFGNGTSAPRTSMMFTSGPGGESHGRWGTIAIA